MLDYYGPWVEMYFLTHCETFKRQSLQLLDRAGAHEADYTLFAMMDGLVNEHREEERERERLERQHGR